ncbi:hypothetical protein H2509_01945 [Stappia sp. F7233]|uniref:Uncharacterized protein n=1 Tax=Stappia albiluteola TaxID=2758565 RepID=A0A839A8N6_9HYPH|nr:hypothetical protein [Stappia albiluteola]MBA5775883.1 hypothetical protein [Stappia albiluteola]
MNASRSGGGGRGDFADSPVTEDLVVDGLRHWLSGYATGSIECWELAWNLFATKLGPARARPAVAALSCYARAINGHFRGNFCLFPHGCPRRCADECLALELLAAVQSGDRPRAAALADRLVRADGLTLTLDAAAALGAALSALGLTLSSRSSDDALQGAADVDAANSTRH